ncbi:DNA fragmentation factor subunit beta [Adelges cooleyi]|uniref:DNA fragmentation factor subunit beta n=1 Tax=Adelges cooleyi TaxID=133065 RepID=UPI00218028CA|nr:DNA fragmentation factor subunit beta [Adelges cooleyi]
MKGYKITNCIRDKQFGIACGTFNVLRIKGCQKLKIHDANVTVILQDGTVIYDEEYFQTLPSQTLFIFKLKGETFHSGADIVYNALKSVNIDLLRTSIKIKEFMDVNIKEKIQVLTSILHADQNEVLTNLTACSLKTKHPQWFEDLDTVANTKEEFMFKRCQDRIRNYMYKTKADIKKSDIYLSDSKQRHYLNEVLEKFTVLLNTNKYNGHYFDRSSDKCLCDKLGTFLCEGAWNQNSCFYEQGTGHKINPYQSRESRIIFSTWNLDHWAERSRSVIPSLFKASTRATVGNKSINVNYFYNLLFTTNNLKLVHIVCHDKGQHDSAKCDPEYFLETKKVIEHTKHSSKSKNTHILQKYF